MIEETVQSISKQYNSHFNTQEIFPGIYTVDYISEAVYTKNDHEGTIQIKYDDISMKTKLILTRFGLTVGVLRFVEISFFSTVMGCTLFRDYIPTNAIHTDSTGIITSEKNINLGTKDESHLRCDVSDNSVVNGIRELVLYRFLFEKPSGYNVFCEPGTIHLRK